MEEVTPTGPSTGVARRQHRIRRTESFLEDAEPLGRRTQIGQVDHLQLQSRLGVDDVQVFGDDPFDGGALSFVVGKPAAVSVLVGVLNVNSVGGSGMKCYFPC